MRGPVTPEQIRWYHHPEEDPSLFWLFPIWTQLVKERGLPGWRWANLCEATTKDQVPTNPFPLEGIDLARSMLRLA